MFEASENLVSRPGELVRDHAAAPDLRSHERSHLVDLAPDMLCIAGFDGFLKYVNAAWHKTLGYTSQELCGRPYIEFVHPDDRHSTLAEVARLADGGDTNLFENRYLAKDGIYRWLLWNACVSLPERLIYAAARDVTEKKLAEDRLKESNAKLAGRERELLGALTALRESHAELHAAQLQLIQAAKMEIVGRLAAGIAHEVKNPLATMFLAAEFIQTRVAKDDPDVATAISEMQTAINRADIVVRELLDFSRLDRLQVRPHDLASVVNASLLMVKHESVRAHVAIQTQFADDLPPVCIDARKIEQVFVNLFMNAIQAMPGGGTLTVRACASPCPGLVAASQGTNVTAERWVIVEVEDTGAGIPHDALAKVFDPFFTTKPIGYGTGLGLTVVRSIVLMHGGSIEIKNHDGGGVTVTLALKGVAHEQKQEGVVDR